jgi:hypothetical protein
MTGKNFSMEHGTTKCVCLIFLFLLTFMYVLQMSSPLRINTDSYRLLSMAISAFCGEGYLVNGHVDQFPLGYPFTVKTLLQIGLSNSTVLILLNLVCLSVALCVLYIWCNSEKDPLFRRLVVIYVLSSYVMIVMLQLELENPLH